MQLRVPKDAWVAFSLQTPTLSPKSIFNSVDARVSSSLMLQGAKPHPTLKENRWNISFWPKMCVWKGELTLPSGFRVTRLSWTEGNFVWQGEKKTLDLGW